MQLFNLLWLISQDSNLLRRFTGISETVINLVDDLDRCDEGSPDIIVLDTDGFEIDENLAIINKLRDDEGPIPLVVVADDLNQDLVKAMLQIKVEGFLVKEIPDNALADAFHSHSKGGFPVTPEVARHMADLLQKGNSKPPLTDTEFKDNEIRILHLLSHGKTKKDISEQLDISEHTIDNQVRRIYKKLGVSSLGAAMGKAFRLGLIS